MRLFVILAAVLISGTASASDYVQKSLKRAADEVGIPHALLSAVCFAESRHQPRAYNFADNGEGDHAIGLCQVLVSTAKSWGIDDDRCSDDFRYRKNDRVYKNCKLFGPYTNAKVAARYLKWQLDRYGGSWINAVAAYNSGTVKLCKTGVVRNKRGHKLYSCEKGGLLNQRYVDRVLKAMTQQGECNEQCYKLKQEKTGTAIEE